MTSLPADRARTTRVQAPHRVDLIGRTVAVRAPVENVAMAQEVALERARTGAQAGPQAGAGLNVMTEVLLVVPAGWNGALVAGLIVVRVVVILAARSVVRAVARMAAPVVVIGVQIVVLAAERIVRASGVARC
jgi:hypothetical protein